MWAYRSRAMRSGGSDHRITQEPTRPLGSYPWGKVCHARMDGNSDQCDRLCRLRRCRDVSPIARSPIRQKITGPLSAAPPDVSVRLVRLTRSTNQPVGLDQGMAAFSLRSQGKADDDEGKAEQQAERHDAPVGRFVRIVKRRDHGLLSSCHRYRKLDTHNAIWVLT